MRRSAPPADPGEAKRRLADATDGVDTFVKRMKIAQAADLDQLAKLRAFELFSKALRAAAGD